MMKGYGLDGRGSICGVNFSLLNSIQTGSGPIEPLIQWVPGVKQSGREADHSSPSTAEIKNGEAITPRPHTSSWIVLNSLRIGTTSSNSIFIQIRQYGLPYFLFGPVIL
jgi:hypothetical protein